MSIGPSRSTIRAMFFGGEGGGLPLPQSGPEWLALLIALALVAWAVRRWLDEG